MASNRRASGRIRQFSTGAGLAAAAAAMIGMGTAHADGGSVPADIGLLDTAQADLAEAFTVTGNSSGAPDFYPELVAIQTPLLSSDNSLVSGFGEALFNGPDQHLAQAAETFLSAAQALGPDTTNLGALGDFASAGFGVDAAIFGEIPSTIVGKLTDQIFDIGGFDSTASPAAADLTSSLGAAAAADPAIFADLLSSIGW